MRTTSLWLEKASGRDLTWQGTVTVDQVQRGLHMRSTARVQVWRTTCDVAGCLEVQTQGEVSVAMPLIRESRPGRRGRLEVAVVVPMTTTVTRITATGEPTVLESSDAAVRLRVVASPSSGPRQVHRLSSLGQNGPRTRLSSTVVSQAPLQATITMGSLTWRSTAGGLARSVERASTVTTAPSPSTELGRAPSME